MTRLHSALQRERAGFPAKAARREDTAVTATGRLGGHYGSLLTRGFVLCFVVILLGLTLGLAPGIAAAQEGPDDITGCPDINSSGTAGQVDYELTTDITASDEGQCLFVGDGASDVWIDGQGHTIELDGGDHGIEIQGDRATVTNVTVVGGGQGIYVYESQGTELRNVEVRQAGARGIWLQAATDARIVDATVLNGDDVGVRINPDGVLSGNVTIENLTAAGNADGIHVTEGSSHEIRNSNVSANEAYGISVDPDTDIDFSDLVVHDNGDAGLDLDTDSAQGSNVDLGPSTDPGTTLSFSAAHVSLDSVDQAASPPENETAIGRYFDAAEVGSEESQLDVAVHYTEEDARTVNESTLDLWRADGSGGWSEIVGSSVDESERTVNASLDSFGTFGAFGQGESDFEVSIENTNAPVLENETLDVTANVTNTGDVTGTQDVSLSLNGSVDAVVDTNESVTLDEGESAELDFTWDTTGHGAGSYEATVASANHSDSETVRVDEPANFSVTVDSPPDSVVAGQTVEVDATVENDGDRPDTQNVALVRDGNELDSAEVSLNGSDTETITLAWTTGSGDVGEHDLAVGSEDDSANESVTVQAPVDFQVSIDETNEPVVEGANLTVTATITNEGDVTGDQTVTLDFGADVEDSAVVTLDANDSETTTLTWETEPGDAGTYTATVASENSSDDSPVTVQEPAEFLVSNVGAPTSVTEGDTVNVTATIENAGGVNETQNVRLERDGSLLDSRNVSVEGGVSEEVTLSWETTAGDASDHTLTVASDDDNATVDVTVEEAADFQVTAIEARTSVTAGDTVSVTATIENQGDEEANQTVTLDVGDGTEDSQDVTLDGDGEQTVTLEWETDPSVDGDYDATVATVNDTNSTSVSVLRPANFSVTIDDVDERVTEGDKLTATVTVENVGEVTGNQTVRFDVGGTDRDSRELELNESESKQFDLSWSTGSDDAGNYTATVAIEDSEDGDASRDVRVLTPPSFSITGVDTDATVEEGDTLPVDVTLRNTGGAEGTRTVSVDVSGATAQENVTIAGKTDGSVTVGVDTGSLDLGNHTVEVDAEDDTASTTVTVEESTGGGLPPVGGGDGPEGFAVSIVEANEPVEIGATVRVTATISNPESSAATETVTLTAGGAERDSQEVEIDANGEETVVLEWDTGSGDAGRHLVEVAGASRSDTTQVTVNEPASALAVTIDETTAPVVEREPLEVTATLEATEDASQSVRLEAPGGETVDSTSVSLASGQSETVTLVWETERGDAGSGFLRVESEDDVATTDVTVQETPAFGVEVTGTSSPVDVEETLTVDARVSSEVDEERRGYVTLAVDGETRDAQAVTLGGSDETETVELTWETGADDAGEYDATVDVGSDSATTGVSVQDGSGPLFPYAPEWTGSAVEYELTSQDTHVGVFFWLTLLVGGLGAYVLATRATLDAQLLGVTLLVAGVRTGTDVLHATVGGAALEPLLALNTALELYVGLLFLAFAAAYVDDDILLERRSVAALAGVAAVGTLAIATNVVHGLVFSDAELAEAAFTYVTAQTGPLGWAILSVTLVSLLFSVGLLVQSFLDGAEPEWRPVGVLASGLCLALVVVGLSVLDRGPLPHYDYTGAGVAGFLALTTTTLFGHGLQRIKHQAQRSLIEDLEDPIVVANDKRVVVEFNGAAADLLPGIATGVRFDRLVAYTPDWPSPGASTTAEQSRSGLLPTRSAASTDTGAIQPATTDHADQEASAGAEIHYLVQTTSVTADTGDSLGYTVRFTDVSELKRRTNALARKNAQLEQVASTISHDLRNPLSVADGYVEIMQDNVPEPGTPVRASTVSDHLAPIQRAVDRMEAIIDDILALARSAESVSTTEAVEYDQLVEEAWRTVDTDEATLFIESTGLVDADGQRLRRILENLFRNAVEHAGEDVAVVTGITDDGFYVADDGPGIPAGERDAVFEEGHTTAADGTGLGLAIVRQLANAHDWEVHLDPEYDGARFVFTGATTMAHRDGPTSSALQHD